MMKPFALVLGLLVPAVPAAAQNKAQSPQTTPAKPTAADLAANMQGAAGQTFDGGIILKTITAEGNILVLTMDGPAGWRSEITPEDISTALVGGFCGPAPEFFSMGIPMRIDSIDGGKLLKGPLVTKCPPAAPAAPATPQ